MLDERGNMDCVHTSDPNMDPIELPVLDAIGYQCVSPRAFGEILNHHEALHLYIEELLGDR